ncbi:MAG: T9SS type A sorting domain-containing protein [Flavobacteriales bacterium]|nr:T9SS type A sorting domain-containing protein [Flavobacteriales bacterium]
MRKIVFCFLLFFSLFTCRAQEIFQRSYGGSGSDHGRAVIECSTGGYLVVGSTNSFYDPSADMYLLRVDEAGDYLWGRNIGESGTPEWAVDVMEDDDGNFLIAGYGINSENSSYDGILLKTDSEGNELWMKYYGGSDWDFFEAMTTDADGIIYLAGQTSESGVQKGWIVKVNEIGVVFNEIPIEETGDARLTGIASCGNGTIVFGGDVYNPQTEERYFIGGRLTDTGALDWTTVITEQYFSAGKCDCNSENNLLSTGREPALSESGESTNMGVLKLNGTDGQLQWFQVFNTELNYEGRGFAISNDDFLYVGGAGENICCDDYDSYTAVLTPNGEAVSAEFTDAFGGADLDKLYDIAVTSDGGYIATGETRSFGNNFQVHLVKLDQDGTRDETNEDFLDITTTDHITEADQSIRVYPNPASETVTIETPSDIDPISLISTRGVMLLERKLPRGNSTIALDVSLLSSGIYTVQIELSNGSIFHRKISRR